MSLSSVVEVTRLEVLIRGKQFCSLLAFLRKMAKNPSNSNHEQGYELPSVLTISKFSAARGREIQIMQKSLASTSGTKLAFQKLPKHMRRRAMSHNVKRLPRRLREIHLNQMKKSGLPPKQKRPSRKYRRRPYNLLSDYMRRQRKHRWLDTHIWHAKRFHMIEKWGYKLPDRPCDKAFRACYRATANHCLLHDISYYSCVEIKGDYNIIINNFKKITNPNAGLTIAAKAYSKGCREGKVTLYKSDDSQKAIGTIYFHWRPSHFDNKRVLWVWIHAAYYSEALDNLINCFQFKLKNSQQELSSETLSYTNLDNIELKELKLELSRFRLTGPLSNPILQNCFQIIENKNDTWLKEYYETNTDNLLLQREYWMNLQKTSTTELPPHLILSLIILDPRLNLPKKRTKSILEVNRPSNNIDVLPEKCADGPLWDCAVRKIIKDSKISNAQLAQLRENLLVPGSDLEEKGAPIPILLIQKPGKQSQENIGYGSGWDIIIPSSWAQPIWISLIMWGARAGGLRETNSIAFEMNQPNCLHPDTTAGATEEHYISDKCRESFFKLPPNKRTNYNKFKMSSPFEWNWNLLLSNWNSTESPPIKDFFVLRDKNMLRNIQKVFTTKAVLPDCLHNCLIPISIKFQSKGLCNQFAIICLPQKADLRKVPTEPICVDPNEKVRKELRRNHKTLLKRLRRRRIRAKKNAKVIPIDMTMLREYRSTMRKLWLPDAKNIRQSCSREVMGFVRDGDFSFLLGQSKVIGYIAMSALPSLLALKSNKVLVRNTNSRQYRLGILEIICE